MLQTRVSVNRVANYKCRAITRPRVLSLKCSNTATPDVQQHKVVAPKPSNTQLQQLDNGGLSVASQDVLEQEQQSAAVLANAPPQKEEVAVRVLTDWADDYQLPDEMSVFDEDGEYFSSRRDLSLAYLPPKSDLPGAAAAIGLITAWALLFRHAAWEYDLFAPFSVSHFLDGLLTFMSLEFINTGLFITTHDSMHGTVTPNNRFLNDVLGSVCISLYAWFDYSMLWTKHWEHHNLCGTPKEDPDFHKGDPHLLPWFLNFMKGYISIKQFVKLQLASTALMFLGAQLPNLLLFWMGSGALSAIRLFYFGTYVPHKPRTGGQEVMSWAKARSAESPSLLSFLRCYHFDMHWEHHRWPFCPWWDLPKARKIRYAAMGSLDD